MAFPSYPVCPGCQCPLVGHRGAPGTASGGQWLRRAEGRARHVDPQRLRDRAGEAGHQGQAAGRHQGGRLLWQAGRAGHQAYRCGGWQSGGLPRVSVSAKQETRDGGLSCPAPAGGQTLSARQAEPADGHRPQGGSGVRLPD
ncbi:hypothetical protein D3C79_578720 [compost metagenome]